MPQQSNERILNRSNYKRRTIASFESIAVYFIDIYYNSLYLEARDMVFKSTKGIGDVKSITEGYQIVLKKYSDSFHTEDFYKSAFAGIHNLIIMRGVGIPYTQCLIRLANEFIPDDYINDTNNEQRQFILQKVLFETNNYIINRIHGEYLPMIIDYRNEENTSIMVSDFIDTLLIKRNEFFTKFLTPTDDNTASNKTISTLRDELKALYKERLELKQYIVALKNIICAKKRTNDSLTEELCDKTTRLAEYEQQVSALRRTLSSTQQELARTKERLYSNVTVVNTGHSTTNERNSSYLNDDTRQNAGFKEDKPSSYLNDDNEQDAGFNGGDPSSYLDDDNEQDAGFNGDKPSSYLDDDNEQDAGFKEDKPSSYSNDDNERSNLHHVGGAKASSFLDSLHLDDTYKDIDSQQPQTDDTKWIPISTDTKKDTSLEDSILQYMQEDIDELADADVWA